MANYKSEYEKVRKATSEANSLLDTESLITKELKFQNTLRESLSNLIKNQSSNILNKMVPAFKTIKSLSDKESKFRLNISNLQVKISEKLDKIKTSTNSRSIAAHKSQLITMKQQLAAYQTNLIKNLAVQKSILSVVGGISDHIDFFKSAIILAVGYFKEFDEMASQFRMKMGIVREDVKLMEKSMYKSWKSLTNVNVTMKELVSSIESISSSFGSIWVATDDIRDSIAVWQSQLGVSTKNGSELLRVFSQLDGSISRSQLNMGNFLTRMTAAAGVPLNETMEDIANSSKTAYSMMARNPLAIAKAAVEARRLGTTLDSIAKSGKSLLNFTDSINSEMNASVLIGKSINLQKARELAHERDLEGLNREIVRLARDEVDFNKLDYFQQEAFAAALGKSADEIAKMIQSEKEINWIRSKGTPEMKRQLAALEEMKRANKSLSNDIGKQAAESLRTQANQAKLTALSNAWKQVMMEIVSIFVPIISSILSVALVLLKVLKPFIVIGTWAFMIYKSFLLIKGAVALFGAAISWPIAAVVALVGALYLVWKYWDEIKSVVINVGKAIWSGIVSVATGLYDALIKPFWDVLVWLKEWFLGSSPSKIGLMMLDGILSIGSMMFNALTSPFKKLWGFVSNVFTNIGRLVIKALSFVGGLIFNKFMTPFKLIKAGVNKVMGNSFNDTSTQSTPNSRMVVHVKNEKDEVSRKSPVGVDTVTKNKENTSDLLPMMGGILEAINGLRQDLNNGKVAVYLDSQLVSTHSVRNTLFRKGYGTNKAIAT